MTTASSSRRIATASFLAAFTLALGAAPVPTATASVQPQAASSTANSSAQASARVAADYSSVFASQAPQMTDSGWNACAGDVSWSIDTRSLTKAQATKQTALVKRSFSAWSKASGLSFSFVGEVPVSYDESSYTVAQVDGGAQRARHIYISFVTDRQSGIITKTTAGFGGPSAVSTATKEIDKGYAFFSADYVRGLKGTSAAAKATNLYLHEIGHALGLGHATSTANIMYSTVSAKTALGAGDTTGVRSFTKTCTA